MTAPDGLPNIRAYRAAVVSFVIAIAGGIAAAIGYGTDNTGDLLGVGLAVSLFGIGFGLVCWAKYLDFDERSVQEREPLVLPPPRARSSTRSSRRPAACSVGASSSSA